MTQGPQQTVIINAPPTNSLGLAGFIVSCIAFFTCGCASPIGLLLSIGGLIQAPRGFAIAGTLLGVLGSWWLWFAGMGMILGMLGLAGAATTASGLRSAEEQAAARHATRAAEGHDASRARPAIREPEASDLPTARSGSSSRPIEEFPNLESATASKDDATPAEQPKPDTNPEPVEAPPSDKIRTWKTDDGKFTVEAEYLWSTGEKVKLKRVDTGKEITVALEKLCQEDRDWITERAKKSRK